MLRTRWARRWQKLGHTDKGALLLTGSPRCEYAQSVGPGLVGRGGGQEPPSAPKSCLQDFLHLWVGALRCHSPDGHQRPPSAHKRGQEEAGLAALGGTVLALPRVGASRVRGSIFRYFPPGPDARALLSLGLEAEEVTPQPQDIPQSLARDCPPCPRRLRGTEGGRRGGAQALAGRTVPSPLSLGRQRKT